MQAASWVEGDPLVLGLQAGLIVLLLLASAFLVGTEAAVRLLSKTSRSIRYDDLSERTRALLKHPRATLFTVIISSTLTCLGAVVLAVMLLLGLVSATALPAGLVLSLGLLLLAVVLLAGVELGPRLYAMRHADRYCQRAAVVVLPLHRVLGPLSYYLDHKAGAAQRLFKSSLPAPNDQSPTAASDRQEGSALDADEDELIHSIVEFSETTVREIMVSRLDVVALPVAASRSEALEIIKESGYSRLPLYVQHLDNVLGIVYVKDLLPYFSNGGGETEQVNWRALARPAMFVPLEKRLDALLRDFQARKTHIAIVVDEYGGTAGLVTMEDVLEEIVGDIRDEHDEEEEEDYQQIDPHTYSIDARMHLDDVCDLLDIQLDTESFDFETLGGLILHLAGAIPEEGDVITYESLHMTVDTVENHRIGRVLVHVEVPAEEVTEERAEKNA